MLNCGFLWNRFIPRSLKNFNAMPLDEVFMRSLDAPIHLEMHLIDMDTVRWRRLGIALRPHRERLKTALLECTEDLTQDVFASELSPNRTRTGVSPTSPCADAPYFTLAQLAGSHLVELDLCDMTINVTRLEEFFQTASQLKVLRLSEIVIQGDIS